MNKDIYSDHTIALINDSRREARRHRSAAVRPEHLLMAMLKNRGTVTGSVMDSLNINRADLTIDCESLLLQDVDNTASAEPAPEDTPAAEALPLAPGMNHLMLLATLEARMSRKDKIEEEHLLLAMLHDDPGSVARNLLERNNMNYDNVTKCLSDIKEQNADNTPLDYGSEPLTSANQDTEVASPTSQAPATDGQTSADTRSGLEIHDEEDDEATPAGGTQQQTAGPEGQKKGTPVIDAFSTDLIKQAEDGVLDPVVGREREILRLQEILCRRKKNNPILIGEPGVGKSAIVEGLAQMIVNHRTSPMLMGKRLVQLDMAGMVAGTKYRGQFEQRIKDLLRELEENPDIIVFIDEIHTIIGAGGASGTMDAANMLKPALARGYMQCIGATTLDEYRNSIEKDSALERRFQKVLVEQNSPEETLAILRNIKDRYEKHHHVQYSDEALEACVKLTERYITDRSFPDKAIDVLDEAGAAKCLGSAVVPEDFAVLEEAIREAKFQKLEAVKAQDFEGAAGYRDQQTRLEAKLAQRRAKWASGEGKEHPVIDAAHIAETVARITGIPVQQLSADETLRLKDMPARLKGKVIGQDMAIDTVSRAIRRNRMGVSPSNKPVGVFMFLGPTGVGKTYLAKKLAEELFGSADALLRFDMSEYSEGFNTSRLVGAPPGYVGYEQGGQLTEKVRRKPYSILLLDEIEKANGQVFNMLLQVLDEGRLTDGNGRLVDFRNTIIIMTSNAGTRQLKDFANGIGFTAAHGTASSMTDKDREYARSIVQKSLSKQFAPEFLNRLDEIVTFDQLTLDSIKQIANLELAPIVRRIEEMGYRLTLTDEAMTKLAEKGYDVQFGARPLKRALQTYVEDVVCDRILDEALEPGAEIVISEIG